MSEMRDAQQTEDEALIRRLRPALEIVMKRETMTREFWDAADEVRDLLKPSTLAALLRVIDHLKQSEADHA